jgi:hypothetical protein
MEIAGQGINPVNSSRVEHVPQSLPQPIACRRQARREI